MDGNLFSQAVVQFAIKFFSLALLGGFCREAINHLRSM